jgi:hypothetical protein
MSIIKTKRNFVCAYEPTEQDSFVEVWLTGDQRRLMLTQTIDHYQEAVDWAVSMADQMALPLEVVTVTASEYLRRQHPALESVPC